MVGDGQLDRVSPVCARLVPVCLRVPARHVFLGIALFVRADARSRTNVYGFTRHLVCCCVYLFFSIPNTACGVTPEICPGGHEGGRMPPYLR